ncbi:cytochrome P450 [Streptomyces sp. DSM 44915]|uniref:Cytochrome P450 n=1 Tax=Streptomyces chisholmiae TaxID=3075540 RepID=A0ABU2JTV2_9ACTN|nr:cytochrome P450 [Streptomyces sp. DSM 44915]MDT0268191.1 cytochrome P450 [Streptomyces sp. DSM 44915]
MAPDAVPLSGERFHTDPHRLYREMRQQHGPVVPVALPGDVPAWLVIGYRELHQLLSDSELFSRDSELWSQWPKIPADWPLGPMIGRRQPSILYTVGEAHTRRVAVTNEALEAVDQIGLRAVVESRADQLVDRICGQGEAELIEDFAKSLPILVLATLLGFREEESQGLSQAMHDMIDGGERAIAGQQHLLGSMRRLISLRRTQPGADVATRMLEGNRGFSDEELVQDMMVIVASGHQTTADWIGNTIRLMLTDDRFAASFFGGRHSVAEAMNEVLWEDTPSQIIAGRWATRDTKLGERHIRAGDMMLLGFQGANDDPQVRVHQAAGGGGVTGSGLTGGNSAFFSFSHGDHRCPFPAVEIAEVIARTGIEVILDRLPDMDLSVSPAALNRRPSPWLRGMTTLPVRFTPTPALGGQR